MTTTIKLVYKGHPTRETWRYLCTGGICKPVSVCYVKVT